MLSRATGRIAAILAIPTMLLLAACIGPGSFPIGNPFGGPRTAEASPSYTPPMAVSSDWTPEQLAEYSRQMSAAERAARASVTAAESIDAAADMAGLIPGAQPWAGLADNASQGYLLEMLHQLRAIDARTQQTGKPPSQSDFAWAIAFALLSGVSTLFSYKVGQNKGVPLAKPSGA